MWYGNWFGNWLGEGDTQYGTQDSEMIKGIIYILENDPAVIAIVGEKEREGGTGDYKIYPVVAPSTEKAPYVVIRQTGGVRLGKGQCGRTVEFTTASVATSYDTVSDLDAAIIDALETAGAGIYNGVTMSSVSAINLSADDFNLEHKVYLKLSTYQVNIQ